MLVYFFKESGKYYTEADVDMPYSEEGYPPDQFKSALKTYLGDRLKNMIAVCIDPNHKFSYPVLVRTNDL